MSQGDLFIPKESSMVVTIGPTRILNVRKMKQADLPADFVYVGRYHPRFGKGSRWANTYSVRDYGMPGAGVAFAKLLLTIHTGRAVAERASSIPPEPLLSELLRTEVLGKSLGCWCVGLHGCHAEPLAHAAMGAWHEVERACYAGWWQR